MRKLLLSALMLYNIAYAQENSQIKYANTIKPNQALITNCKLRINEVDDFTGDVKKMSKYITVGSNDIGFLTASVGRVQKSRFIYLKFSQDLGCLSNYDSYAIIKYTDGTTQRMDNMNDTDCGDKPTFLAYLEGDKNSNTIEKLRLSYSDYYTDIIIKKKSFIIDGLNCVE